MFEPDGRNSIQTMGHWAASAVKFALTVIGVLAIAPTVVFMMARVKLGYQERTILAYNEFVPMQAVLVDFNSPDIKGYETTTDTDWGWDAARTLPFHMMVLRDATPKANVHTWVPSVGGEGMGDDLGFDFWKRIEQHGNAWVYANLPFSEHGPYETGEGVAGGTPDIWPNGYYTRYSGGGECQRAILTQAVSARPGSSAIPETIAGDPWVANGALKLAPTKWWDWYTGQQLLHAKSSYNYRAYVSAARTVAAMRFVAAVRKAGGWAHVDVVAGIPVPAAAIRWESQTPGHHRKFVETYCSAFRGKLPRVVMHLQSLAEDETKKAPMLQSSGDPGGYHGITSKGLSLWPFVTGMHLVEGDLRPVPRSLGRPVFTKMDFFVNSTPAQNPDSLKAQQALLEMLQPSYWKPLFAAEGLTDADTLSLMEETLARIRTDLDNDAKWCRRWSHKFYRHNVQIDI